MHLINASMFCFQDSIGSVSLQRWCVSCGREMPSTFRFVARNVGLMLARPSIECGVVAVFPSRPEVSPFQRSDISLLTGSCASYEFHSFACWTPDSVSSDIVNGFDSKFTKVVCCLKNTSDKFIANFSASYRVPSVRLLSLFRIGDLNFTKLRTFLLSYSPHL